ncbi:MAG: hypothetical protein E6H92_08410 [Chloroflexi bacterium]|nr:MAG: hypothetical protein E6H92_08410 [Chloroflexota bacterium]
MSPKLIRPDQFGELKFAGVAAFLNLFTRKKPCIFCGLPTTRQTTGGYCHLSCTIERLKPRERTQPFR